MGALRRYVTGLGLLWPESNVRAEAKHSDGFLFLHGVAKSYNKGLLPMRWWVL